LTNGELAAVGTTTANPNPSYLVFHPTLDLVFALNEDSPGAVFSFSINRTSGALNQINTVPSGGDGPAHISIHKNGKWLFVSHYTNGIISVLNVKTNGSIDTTPLFTELAGGKAHHAITDSEGKYLFVVCLDADYIVQYIINSDGTLKRNTPATVSFPIGTGPRHMTFHPSANFVYVLSETSNQVFTLAYNANGGTLTIVQNVSSLPSTFNGTSYGAEIQTDGNFVLVSNRGYNSIGVFSIDDKTSGLIKPSNWVTDNINWPRHFTFDPTKKFVLVANQRSNNAVVFSYSNGVLSGSKVVTTRTQPSFIGFLPGSSSPTSGNESGAVSIGFSLALFAVFFV